MGCMSEVTVATTREGYERICRRVDEMGAGNDEEQIIGSEIEPDYYEEHEGCVAFGWDGIKWYECYSDIYNVITAIRELEDVGIPYEFCRIAAWDDVEFERHVGDKRLSIWIEPHTTTEIYK